MIEAISVSLLVEWRAAARTRVRLGGDATAVTGRFCPGIMPPGWVSPAVSDATLYTVMTLSEFRTS